MKNIINEKPSDELHGRTKYILKYVDDEDINDRDVLDIGCGFGWFEYRMLKKGVNHISGIDMTKTDIEMNKAYFNDSRVDFKVGSAVELPYRDASFDTVVSWDVIEHIPKNTEIKMMSEIERVLKPGGVFYISTPYRSFLGTTLDPAWWLIKHRHYTQKKIEFITKEVDSLEILHMEIRGGIWDILAIVNLYVAKWIFRRSIFFPSFFYNKVDREYEKGRGGLNSLFVKGRKK